jgi:hypothetical protein
MTVVGGVLVVVGVFVIPAAINFAKGKIGWGLCSLIGLLWPFAVGAAIRLARPESWWARRLYDEETMARSRERFAEERLGSFETKLEDGHKRSTGEPLQYECAVCGEVFGDQEAAEHHAAQHHPEATPASAVSRLTDV